MHHFSEDIEFDNIIACCLEMLQKTFLENNDVLWNKIGPYYNKSK